MCFYNIQTITLTYISSLFSHTISTYSKVKKNKYIIKKRWEGKNEKKKAKEEAYVHKKM